MHLHYARQVRFVSRSFWQEVERCAERQGPAFGPGFFFYEPYLITEG